ncbi:MAG: helix-turn-helix domain-containing protein [Burkholderiales bacterium]
MSIEAAPVAAADPAGLAGAGARLRAAREAQGLAAVDVARHLRLSPHQIEALETDDHGKLPGPVFVRGFLRNYARLVKLDPDTVVVAPPSLAPLPQVAPDVPPALGAPFSGARDFTWLRYAAIALALTVPFGIYLALDDGPDTAPMAVVAPLTPSPLPPDVAKDVPQAPAVAEPASALAPAAMAEDGVKAASTAEVPLAMKRKPGDHVIRLLFERESWVELRDAEGRKLYSQLNTAGTTQTISGTPPLSLIIGNAAGVRMTVNDRPYDLAPYVKVDVARLTLE